MPGTLPLPGALPVPGTLRVAYVLGTSAGGTGAHVAMLVRGCRDRGITVTVLAPEQTGRQFFPGDFEPVEIGDKPRPASDLPAVRRLRSLIQRAEPHVVHAHGVRAGAAAALAIGRDRRRGLPRLVVTLHNAPPPGAMAASVYTILERLVARRAAAVTWVSADLGDRVRRLGAVDGGQALVPAPSLGTPSPGEVARVRAALAAPGRPLIVAAGRLAPQKGFGPLLEAATVWQGRAVVPMLAIAGDGPLAGPLGEQARAAGLAVTFLGRRDDIAALLAAADLVVVPSLWEGQPLIVQEALRAGCPLVATRVGGIPSLTGEEDAAVLVPPGDAAALAAAVLSVLDDPAYAARLAKAARARAAALPAESDAVAAVAGLYQRVMPGSP